MANEIQYSTALSYAKNNGSIVRNSGTVNVTVTGNYVSEGIMTCPTSNKSVPVGDIVTLGLVMLHNCDVANNILISSDGILFDRVIWPGEWLIYRANANTITAKAVTASCLLEFYLFSA